MKLVILLGLLLAGRSAFGQQSAIYPEQKGVVSDYAGKLGDAQIRELTSLIQDYEQQTSIQFVVVVVDDLHGQSAGQYAIGLGDFWGVGQAGRDNGVILLWAPRERAYSLRIAHGLKADLSDSDAATVTRQYLLPYFKSQQYYAGLKAAVLETMRRLGSQTWEERVQSRAQAAQHEQQAAQRRLAEQAEENQAYKRIIFIAVLLLAVSSVAVAVIYKWRGRQETLGEMAEAKGAIADDLAKAEENGPRIQQLLDEFAKESPEQDISALRTGLAEQPARILQIKVDATVLDFSNINSYDQIIDAKTRAATESDLLESVQQKVASIRSAKQRSRTLMDQMSRETFTISELRDSSRRNEIDTLLSQSRLDYEQARQNSSLSLVDWLIIDDLLSRSHQQAQQAVAFSQTEAYVPSPSFYDSSDSSSTSSSSSFDSSSSSGGGGFDSGSGSDGSY